MKRVCTGAVLAPTVAFFPTGISGKNGPKRVEITEGKPSKLSSRELHRFIIA